MGSKLLGRGPNALGPMIEGSGTDAPASAAQAQRSLSHGMQLQIQCCRGSHAPTCRHHMPASILKGSTCWAMRELIAAIFQAASFLTAVRDFRTQHELRVAGQRLMNCTGKL